MRRLLRVAWAVLALAAVAAFAPGVARAQTEVALTGVFTDTASSATGPAAGAFSLTNFAAEGHTLVANGSAAVGFCVPGVDPKNCLASFSVALTTTVTDVSGTCDAIVVTLGAIHIVVGGDRFVVDLEAESPLVLTGGTRQFRCAIARRAMSTEPLFTLAASLNLLLADD
jgi:hypothetical protein